MAWFRQTRKFCQASRPTQKRPTRVDVKSKSGLHWKSLTSELERYWSHSRPSKQANCIEHALLFASICRAIDIPTRIALGVKFNQSAEMPEMKFHAWVEIRDGSRWVPMDSTEEAFPTSIDRIKIKESNFNTKNPYLDVLSVYRLLPELEIQVLPQ